MSGIMRYAVTTLAVLFSAVIWLAIPHPAHAYTSISGNISSDTTLYTGEVYVVYGYVSVEPGAKLTIEPGTIVKFNYEASLTVLGELTANGAPDSKIYFTAVRDDTVGGDTNGDGSATSPAIGDWSKISVFADGIVNLNHSLVRFGGTWPQYTNIFQSGGTLNVSNSTSEFSYNGFRIAGGVTTIEDSLIKDNQYGLEATGPGSLALNNNIFTDNIDGSAFVAFNDGKSFVSSGNTASGNGQNGIIVSGAMSTDQIWTDQMPYIILNLTVSAGKTLTVNAGAKVKFNYGSFMTVSGNLNVNGTSANQVYFTSIRDDSIGGDTNNDGFSSGAPGDWNQITIAAGSVTN
ncbi:MAG: hypothetical protein Q8R55_00145, partial [Candidatus Taylorbacteria bacterium]|nr:hypothetical protein [Candidatus Taylorbacteria bacterium]